jgi:hypothetical protein
MKARDWRISFNHFIQNKWTDNGGGKIVEVAGRGTRGEGIFEAFTGTGLSMKLKPTLLEAISLLLSTGVMCWVTQLPTAFILHTVIRGNFSASVNRSDVLSNTTVHCIYTSYSGSLVQWFPLCYIKHTAKCGLCKITAWNCSVWIIKGVTLLLSEFIKNVKIFILMNTCYIWKGLKL